MDAGGGVELRVHGVSQTPPEQLLDCPLVPQVAGDTGWPTPLGATAWIRNAFRVVAVIRQKW